MPTPFPRATEELFDTEAPRNSMVLTERKNRMLVDVTVIPLRGGRHTSDEVAEVIKLIDASGLPYQLTPSGTCIEGDWGAVMPLIQRCHNVVRSMSSHVVTLIKIEDESGKTNKLTTNIESVEHRIGRSVGRSSKLITVHTAPSGN